MGGSEQAALIQALMAQRAQQNPQLQYLQQFVNSRLPAKQPSVNNSTSSETIFPLPGGVRG